MTDPRDPADTPCLDPAEEPCGGGGIALRLVPMRYDGEPEPAPTTRLIREFKGHSVPDFGLARREPESWLPEDDSESNVVAGPGFGRRPVFGVLWPLLAFVVLVVLTAVWIAIS